MRNRVGMCFFGHREASKVLARLEQRRQRQAPGITAGVRANEGEISILQVIAGSQLLAGQPRARARVSRAVNRRHGLSGKGSAAAGGQSVGFEGNGR